MSLHSLARLFFCWQTFQEQPRTTETKLLTKGSTKILWQRKKKEDSVETKKKPHLSLQNLRFSKTFVCQMRILDVTKLLNSGEPNHYTFNPAVLSVGNNSVLIAYRNVGYDLKNIVSCWDVWNRGYELFPSMSRAANAKYRNSLGPAIRQPLRTTSLIKIARSEVDTTGLAFVQLQPLCVIWNVAQLFGFEFNQDARLCIADGKLWIIYNVFETSRISLRARQIEFSDNEVILSAERYLFDHIFQAVEKHCCFEDTTKIIQYEIGPAFSRLVDGQLQQTTCSLFEWMLRKFGRKNVLFSLSTPSLSIGNKRIACGHVKIAYKTAHNFDFLQRCDLQKVKLHGKFIYFAFLYETLGSQVLRVSPPFLPSLNNNHLPYLLVMPIGLTRMESDFVLSYGEGDARCKLLFLSLKEVNQLLDSKCQEPCFLTEQMDITHIGYFHEQNCGDDAYEQVFSSFYQDTPHNVHFTNQFSQRTSLNVLGGGDVVNRFFIPENLAARNNVAISVGIPYLEFAPLLSLFRRVFLRNLQDALTYQCDFIPDLTFLLSDMYGMVPRSQRASRSVGIVLTRHYYHPDYLELYRDFCREMAVFLENLHIDGWHVVFIAFCTNTEKPLHNDLCMIADIAKILSFEPEIFQGPTVKDTFLKMGRMTFNVCTRYHAHIFSVAHHVPFISLTCGRKCIEFMRDLRECLFLLQKNEIDLPLGFRGQALYAFFCSTYAQRFAIEKKLIALHSAWLGMLRTFQQKFLPLLRSVADNLQTVLWRPKLRPKLRIPCKIPGEQPDHCISSSPCLARETFLDF